MTPVNKSEWTTGVGLMSGTSMDGIDIAVCAFRFTNKWEYQIIDAVTFPYMDSVRKLLIEMQTMSGPELIRADRKLGHYYGEIVSGFLMGMGHDATYIASHGHTIFHNPNDQYTFQAGHGAAIAAETGLPVICDFRSTDVALGGQGAPLVPIGDSLLFDEYDALLNLGGFANISMQSDKKRIAWDICPVNIVLNHFAQKCGMDYDTDGKLAANGNCNADLLKQLNSLPFYQKPHPKSLGREWVEDIFLPLVEQNDHLSTEDILATTAHHAAMQINHAAAPAQNVLVTGGGARNPFLMNLLREQLQNKMIIPDETTIDFKEALVFAFMGLLRILGEDNTLETATGARKQVSGGAMYLP